MIPSQTLVSNFCTSKAGLAVGTTTTTTTANASLYCIAGKAYTAAGASNAATPTTDAVTGAAFTALALNKAGVFVICLDTSGALKIVQGGIVDYTDAGTYAEFNAGTRILTVVVNGTSRTASVALLEQRTAGGHFDEKVFARSHSMPSPCGGRTASARLCRRLPVQGNCQRFHESLRARRID